MGKGGMGKPVENPDPEEDKKIIPLDEDDIALLKTYGLGPYSNSIKTLETDLKVGLLDLGLSGGTPSVPHPMPPQFVKFNTLPARPP